MKMIMKRKNTHSAAAFTRLELVVVLVILAVLAVFASTYMLRGHSEAVAKSKRIACLNNLVNIGVSYRVWANDHNDKYPAEVSIKGGGWQDFLTNQNQGAWCWTNFVIMKEMLGNDPKILICPADDRMPASSIAGLKSNTNVSYFVGVGASDAHPQSILGGDRNLCRGLMPPNDYGFSPASGMGNDVAVQPNENADPISWSAKMHSNGRAVSRGNIILGDASGQQVSSARFRSDYQRFALDNGNWPSNHVPTAPSFRLIFP